MGQLDRRVLLDLQAREVRRENMVFKASKVMLDPRDKRVRRETQVLLDRLDRPVIRVQLVLLELKATKAP